MIQLRQVASPGGACVQRLAHYMLEALHQRYAGRAAGTPQPALLTYAGGTSGAPEPAPLCHSGVSVGTPETVSLGYAGGAGNTGTCTLGDVPQGHGAPHGTPGSELVPRKASDAFDWYSVSAGFSLLRKKKEEEKTPSSGTL